MEKFYVYALITCDTQESFYIGKAVGNRSKRHRKLATNEKLSHLHVYRKIRKLWENGRDYYDEILFKTDDEKEALEKEMEYIDKIGIKNLCNSTMGGEGSSLSEEQKTILKDKINNDEDRMSHLRRLAMKVSKQVQRMDDGRIFNSIRDAASDFGVSPRGLENAIKDGRPCKGVTFRFFSEDSSEFISIPVERAYGQGQKRIIRKDTGEIFNSLKLAAESVGKAVSTLCCAISRGTFCGGVEFAYYEEGMENQELPRLERDPRKLIRPVRNCETGQIFESVTAAAESIGRSSSTLTTQIQDGRPCAGVLFEYVDSPIEYKEVDPTIRPIICIDTGVFYPSITAAAESIGRSRSSLYFALENQTLCAGTRWAYSI